MLFEGADVPFRPGYYGHAWNGISAGKMHGCWCDSFASASKRAPLESVGIEAPPANIGF
jgi:hypothetical protein